MCFSSVTFSTLGTGAKWWRIDSDQNYCLSKEYNKVRKGKAAEVV